MSNICSGLAECEYLKLLFDKVRVINPLKNEIIHIFSKGVNESDGKCYSIWNKSNMCENCISMRAYNENKVFTKVEYNDNRVFAITAIPMNKGREHYVIECIKDITDSMLINEVSCIAISEICEEIEKLNKLVITDELTECYNRRYINERFPLEIKESKRKNEKLTIVLMDIDNFKKINDKYGHQSGDYVLKEIGKIVKSNIRKEYDWVSRYGGEEFLIVFKNMDTENFIKSTEKIRKSIEEHKFIYNGVEIKLTASFGVAELSDKIDEMDMLIAEADKKLYKAKELGKNIVII
ncbi:GGDEF domain-containing protein [Clostridium sp. NSJ-145]|uniref:GGDEF domain-containing protein n=1 Tax=Clostridium sp. NSJ-145 TaxID=2897777 RepID=UPI001E48B166|nr:GGDEF domain-containing protein [Clostridium sp. NSJ-145]MCD2500727.1 GGDEF domain-containing protein [Clostridium sp. NSJ-145]